VEKNPGAVARRTLLHFNYAFIQTEVPRFLHKSTMLRPAKEAPAQTAQQENPMNALHYIGFDVHKKTISFCVKTAGGEIAGPPTSS
jgi:hypothetical protein